MIRILFCVFADAANVNAQSQNAREIALRLDPRRFTSTFFHLADPDPRLIGRAGIHLVRLPPRLGSFPMAAHVIRGKYDLLFYPPANQIMAWYRALRPVARRERIIANVEGTAAQLRAIPEPEQSRYLRILREADCRVSISPYIAQTLKDEFGLDSHCIPIGVDTRFFACGDRRRVTHEHATGSSLGLSPSGIRRVRASGAGPCQVLYVGSIQPRKQVHLLLDLARRIGPERAEFHIVGEAIGSGDYEGEQRRRKEKEGLGHVHFHGKLAREQIRERMQAADVFLLPSRLEGTPKVLFEAAAAGLPCIVFDDYRTPSVVDGETGFQVKTFEEMLEKLVLLIEQPELRDRLGRAGVEHIKPFDWDCVAQEWERLFISLCREKAATESRGRIDR